MPIYMGFVCDTSSGGLVGMHDNGDGTVSPTCTSTAATWTLADQSFLAQTIPTDQVGPLLTACFVFCGALIVARQVDKALNN